MSVLEKENSMFMIFMTAVMLILTAVIAWQFKTNLYVFLTKKKFDNIDWNYKLWQINLILNRTSDLKYLTETKIYKVFKNQLKMNF